MGQDQGPKTVRLILRVVVEYEPNDTPLEELRGRLIGQMMGPCPELTEHTTAKIRMTHSSVVLDKRPEEEQHKGEQGVAVVGNLSEGFRFVGPYPDFDTAAEAWDGCDSWIATLHAPTLLPATVEVPVAAQELIARLEGFDHHRVREALDDLVHDQVSRSGSAINNDGYDAQIRFLVQELGLEATEVAVASMIAQASGDSPDKE